MKMKELGETAVSTTAAFEQQLTALCIREFPCGFGTWRAPENVSNTSIKSATIYRTAVTSQTDTCTQSAQHESVEDLKELALKAPYHVDCSWSNEAKELREIAVMTPEKLNHNFILKHFKSLRIVDKKVTEIDEGLLQFRNLKQLTLSANLITEVSSKKLPKELEELELCANRITDIGLLCVDPPPLIHLGLGFNLISSISGYMNPDAWANLLSLDLSSNNLCDLVNTVNVLKTLPQLRNLLLIGNPLALSPGYRGYTVDSVRYLTILDDIRISADEKHYFKGLAKLKEIPLDEAVVTMSLPTLSGVKMPEQAEDSELQSEYPKIEFKYHVKFRFVKNTRAEVMAASPALSVPTISVVSPDGESEKIEDDDRPSSKATADTTEQDDIFINVETEGQPWSEDVIQLNYNERFHTNHLMPLRDFIKEGIEFSVIETKHFYVLEDPNAQSGETFESTPTKNPPASKSEKGKRSANKDKGKDSPGKGKAKAKDSKSKGKHDVDLFELPSQQRTLGSCYIPLNTLLEGEYVVKAEGVCPPTEQTETDASVEGAGKDASQHVKSANTTEKKKNTKGDASEKGGKGAHAQRATTPAKPKGGKDNKGKSSDKGKDEKGGKNKDKQQEESHEVNEEENVPPPPLTVHVHITLHNWKSAREAAQDCPTRPATATTTQ